MDSVASLRLDTLNIRVEPCKHFQPPEWAVPGNVADTGAALHVIKGGEVIDTLKVDDSRLYTLFGRCPTVSDDVGVAVRLEHPSVSRIHAAVLRGKENILFVIDLGSSHGTYVSGKRIEPFSAVALHDRSVLVFGQSTRRYIVRIFPKRIDDNVDAEEANTVLNCMVGYKDESLSGESPRSSRLSIDDSCGKLERRVSFSCLAPEIIPSLPARPQEGSTTPLGFFGGSPEVGMFRKLLSGSPRLSLPDVEMLDARQTRAKSDSLPSIQANSGSDEDDENSSSLESLELSPILGTIDEMREVLPEQTLGHVGRKTFFKRLPVKLEAFAKRVRPDH